MKLFLDDIREPKDCTSYMYKRIGKLNPIYLEDWSIVRNFNDFKSFIEENINEITHISFDHDLGEDVAIELHKNGLSKRKARTSKKLVKSGYDCAKFTKEFYEKNKQELPIMFVHSMNPVGTDKIINLFK